MNKAMITVAAALLVSTAAIAQDSTTTTTTERHTAPGSGVTVGVPGIVGVHVGGPSEHCSTKRRTTTDDETGDSVTREASNC
jgi:hypothetical protein